MAADKGKKLKVADKEEDEDSVAIDEKLVFSIEKLQEIQDELEKINEEASDKVLEVEQKYNEIRKPVYDKRNEIINSIPDFWLTAFLSHPALNELLTEEDQKIFRYLSSLEVEDFKDMKSGYSIAFNFKPNPYFEDTKISKSFSFLEEGTTKISATSIKWTEGMGLSNGSNVKKKGNKRPPADERFVFSSSRLKSTVIKILQKYYNGASNFSEFAIVNELSNDLYSDDVIQDANKLKSKVCPGVLRALLKSLEVTCFFSWFNETQPKDIDEIHDAIAEIIKEELWPNPLTYFNNEADEEDFDEDADEEGKQDGSEEDDQEGDEEDDDNEEDEEDDDN